METSAAESSATSAFALEAYTDIATAEPLGALPSAPEIAWNVRKGRRSLWFVATVAGRDILALRGGCRRRGPARAVRIVPLAAGG